MPGGYDHAVYGADVTLAPLNLCAETLDGMRNHSWRRPPPSTPEGEVVAWADRIAYVCHDFEDASGPGSSPLPISPTRWPRSRASRALTHRGVRPCRARRDRPDRAGGDDRARGRSSRRVPGVQLRPHLSAPAARRQAEKVVALLRGLVDFFVDAPSRLPDAATGMHPGLVPGSLEAAAVAVRYVSGMTDRYAVGLGVELLGWRPEDLPRGV